MYFQSFQPKAELRSHIHSYYYFRSRIKEVQQDSSFCFPSDGGPELIINRGDPFWAGSGAEKLRSFSGCSLIGPLTRHLMTRTRGRTDFIAVRFLPGKSSPFFKVPCSEIADHSTEIEAFQASTERVFDKIVRGRINVPETIQKMEAFFLSRLSKHHTADNRIEWTIDNILACNGQVRISALAKSIGLSIRQFERRFGKLVGLSPKRLCRIARFQHAISISQRGKKMNWAEIAALCGYSDQAHLIRECRFFTGYSLDAYLRYRSPLEDALL